MTRTTLRIAIPICAFAVLIAPAAATASESLPRAIDSSPAEMPLRIAPRPTGGQKICMVGLDRKCGPARSFGPWTVDEAPQSPACSAHFCVHWVPRSKHAPNPADRDGDDLPFEKSGPADDDGVSDFVEEVAVVSEHSYTVMVDRLGWQPPLPDGGRGGDDRTDIYLFNTDENPRAGALAVYDAPRGNPARHRSGWLILDDDYDDPVYHGDAPARVLEYYVPHELNHIFQVGYDVYLDGWVFEATADWIASQVYPHPQFFAFTGALVGTSTQPLYRSGYRAYSFAAWNAWLASRLGPEVIRKVWEMADQFPKQGHYSTEIFDRAIRETSNGASSFGNEFVRFATATAEWSNKDFEAGNFFTDIVREGTIDPAGGAEKLRLAESAWALYDVRVPAEPVARYRLSVNVQRSTPSGIALIGRRGDLVVRSITDLSRGGSGSVSLRSPPGGFERVTAVLVNTEIRHGGYGNKGNPRFSARVGTR